MKGIAYLETPRSMSFFTCKNCEAQFDASFEYCPHCGQRSADKLTVGVLFSNTISNYFSIDARFFKSILPLILKPGYLAKEFVEGRRLKYLHPAQFYLFVSVVFFFLFSFGVRKADRNVTDLFKEGFQKEATLDSLLAIKSKLGSDSALGDLSNRGIVAGASSEDLRTIDSMIERTEKGAAVSFDFDRKVLDSLIAEGATKEQKLIAMGMKPDAGALMRRFYGQMLKFYEQQGGGILETIYESIPVAMFFLLPLFAFIVQLFYWKNGKFAHHLVFSFSFFTFLFASFSTLLLLGMLFDFPGWLEWVIWLLFLLYFIAALRTFYGGRRRVALIKACGITLVFTMFVIPIAAFGLTFVSILVY